MCFGFCNLGRDRPHKSTSSPQSSLLGLDKIMELHETLGAKRTLHQRWQHLIDAEANRSINPRPLRIPIRTHYSSKVNPVVMAPKSSANAENGDKASSVSSGKSSLIRSVTNSSIRRARAVSNASAKSVKSVWRDGLLAAFEKSKMLLILFFILS